MSDEKGKSKPIWQVVLFELGAAYALFTLVQKGNAQDPWTIRFVYNACFFLAAYPFLAFWRAGGVPGLIRFILFPLGWALRIALLFSTYLWVIYAFWVLHLDGYLRLMVDRPFAIGVLFFFLYWSFFGPILGTTGKGVGLIGFFRLLLLTVVVGGIGYLIGRGLDVTLAARQWPEDKRLWLVILLTMVFMLIGSWGAKWGGKDKA